MAETKNVLMRFDPKLAEALQVVARVEERSVSEVVREAVQALVDQRRRDRRFQRRLARTLGDQEQVLRAFLEDPR